MCSSALPDHTYRYEMNKEEDDSTERLLVGSLPDITTLWAQKKVCSSLFS